MFNGNESVSAFAVYKSDKTSDSSSKQKRQKKRKIIKRNKQKVATITELENKQKSLKKDLITIKKKLRDKHEVKKHKMEKFSNVNNSMNSFDRKFWLNVKLNSTPSIQNDSSVTSLQKKKKNKVSTIPLDVKQSGFNSSVEIPITPSQKKNKKNKKTDSAITLDIKQNGFDSPVKISATPSQKKNKVSTIKPDIKQNGFDSSVTPPQKKKKNSAINLDVKENEFDSPVTPPQKKSKKKVSTIKLDGKENKFDSSVTPPQKKKKNSTINLDVKANEFDSPVTPPQKKSKKKVSTIKLDVKENKFDSSVEPSPKKIKTKTLTSNENWNKQRFAQQNIPKQIKMKNKHVIPMKNLNDSVKTGENTLQWLINPIQLKKFFNENWESQPIVVKRSSSSYYSYLLSSEEIDLALRKQQLFFSKNIDITSYDQKTGVRETHNPPGRATAPLVWDYYSNGCSIRILNPQTFFRRIHSLNASLQEYFGCFVGANVYLTPAGTQGFAPHYDDIEAFVLQIEGEKLWKLYMPRSSAEVLPRFSSGNFTEDDIGPPILEVLLQAGDMLYFPRGIIHQGMALEHTHSLHITLSMYQKNSWADFLETLLPATLKFAIEEDVSFREGLPMHYLSHLGLVNSDKNSEIRSQFLNKLQILMTKLADYAPVDAAVDQLGKRFIHDSLPAYLRNWEKERTIFGDGERIKKGVVFNQAEMSLDTRIKLTRLNCIRLVSEENTIKIYHSMNNSKEYHGEDLQYLEIDEELAPAVDALINAYPKFLTVEQLPIESDIAKVQIASDFWEYGLILTEYPLGYTSGED